jgi:tetratricopeptide (TPR) repeat protein
VGRNSRAGLILHNDGLLRLAENSNVRFNAPTEEGNFFLDLLNGIAHIISRFRQPYQVNTPYINAHVEGTEFTIESHPDSARVTLLEGKVVAYNEYGEVTVTDGQQAKSLPSQAPRSRIVANPRDAVRWALYYPPVIEPPQDSTSEGVRRSIAANRMGELNDALNALDEVPGIENNVQLMVYRASLYLQVGSIEDARQDLTTALLLQPEHADAMALMSLIATANNETQQAIDLAMQAVSVDTQSPSAYLAMSYALQGRFQLAEAREAAKQATIVAPHNALAWARLSQLELMFRNLSSSSEAARRAAVIAPGHAQIQTTLGFVRLIQFDLEDAQQAFELAASLDQAAPLPRLGLGLVQIRKGDVQAGRHKLEIAANLDPGNALIRSYLGKAYYEEKQDTLATTQFSLAKQFDELDPTAWFYDAINKQASNRPIEALQEIQTSIDLNNNRTVYRSRLLLDQDEAARGVSQARIYQELGFDQLARKEAYKSLQTSVHNHSAHRLLADSYAGEPRYERALMSELLQSQLLQPLNTSPIQPQLAVSNLGILDGAGPTGAGYSEFTPMFTREGLNVQVNAIGGNNSTWGDDLILSGLRDKMSFSLGQFVYDTDGWRENSDLRHEIYNAFLQYSLSPSTIIQFEYRQQDATNGDLGLKFDLDDFFPFMRNHLDRRLGRIGFHHQFSSSSHFIASVIYQDFMKKSINEESSDFMNNIPPYGDLSGTFEISEVVTRDSNAKNLELQYIQYLGEHTFTFGCGLFDEDFTLGYQQTMKEIYPLPETSDTLVRTLVDFDDILQTDPSFNNLYIYSLLSLPAQITMTIGATFEDFESTIIETQQLGPKLGLSWDVFDNVTLRVAYLESLARPLQFEQSIEQTQIAGFNQRFDDVEGSEIKQLGFGVDAKLGRDINIGAEFIRRDLLSPLVNTDIQHEGRDEKLIRSYAYWTTTKRLGMRIGYEKEVMERAFFSPQSLTTQRTPIGLSYHWPSGLYLDVEGTWVDQEINQNGVASQDEFWNVDAVLGYRFPKRLGKAEIIVKNLLEEEFNYRDLNFYTGDILMPRFQPKQQLFFRVTHNF